MYTHLDNWAYTTPEFIEVRLKNIEKEFKKLQKEKKRLKKLKRRLVTLEQKRLKTRA